MGWTKANNCSSKEWKDRFLIIIYLQILVSSVNQEALTQIKKFMKYIEQKFSDLLKDVNYII